MDATCHEAQLLPSNEVSHNGQLSRDVQHEHPVGRGTSSAAFINFFKSMFGVGVLGLPHAFEQSGLLAGIVFYIVIAILCTYSMQLIIKCKHRLEPLDKQIGYHVPSSSGRSHTAPLVTYGELARVVLGRWGKYCVDFQLVLLEMLFNAGFQIVMSKTLASLVPNISQIEWIGIVALPIAVMSCIRWLRDLWFLSLFGLIVYLGGVRWCRGIAFASLWEVIKYLSGTRNQGTYKQKPALI
eukprot:m.856300 g.856300  ORF g.856300 m.856300 type:complete len:240 (-) comp23512_c0_seq11:4179-4898(-)